MVIVVTLQPYFQVHTITITNTQPLLQILHKPNVLGYLRKWAMEISEYDIKIMLAKVIKGHGVAEIMVEIAPPMESAVGRSWIIFMDGSSSRSNGGVG